MAADEGALSVSSSLFKNLLSAYTKKAELPEPVYEIVEEGPAHRQFVRSTVVVNGVKYYSMPGFSNRKVAQQSAAEVALMELARSSGDKKNIYTEILESGACKTMLLIHAEKMNYAAPIYESKRDVVVDKEMFFSCTVEIGGARYTGVAARTKKEAEIKAASAALLAIHPSSLDVRTRLTLFPGKRKIETVKNLQDTPSALKAKKTKKKMATKNISGVLQTLEGQSVVSNGDQSNLSGLKETPIALKPKNAKCKKRRKKMATQIPISVLGMQEARVEGTPSPHTNSDLQTPKGQSVGEPTPNTNTELPTQKEQSAASNNDQIKETPSALKEEARHVEGAPTHDNGELKTLKGHAVVSSGDQRNLSGSKETPNALKPKKARWKKRKMETQIPSSALGMEEAGVEGTPTPHTNGELQTPKEQSVGAPVPHINGELQIQKELSVAPNGDQSNPSGLGQTPPSALKPKKAKLKKKKMATQNPRGVLGKEGARQVEDAPPHHTNIELQTPKGQPMGTPTPRTNEELQTPSVASNGDKSNPSGLKDIPSGVLGTEEARQVEDAPTPHTSTELQTPKGQPMGTPTPRTNEELQTPSVASNGDKSNPSGLKDIPSGVLGTEEARQVEDAPTPHTSTELQTPKGQPMGTPTPHTNEELQTLSVASNGDQSNPSALKETPSALKPKRSNSKKKRKMATQNPIGVLGMEEASRLQTQEEQSNRCLEPVQREH